MIGYSYLKNELITVEHKVWTQSRRGLQQGVSEFLKNYMSSMAGP